MSDREAVVVVGAGLMGTGIAHAFASSGHPTTLIDTDPAALARAQAAITAILDGGVQLGKLAAEARDAALARLWTAAAIESAPQGVTLLVETATEDLGIKQAIVRAAEARLGRAAVIATNTSALSITEIAAAARHPERVIGMHFFNPVHKMKLVEVIRGLETDGATRDRVHALARGLGKTTIEVNEAPGFATSRMSALMGNEAMTMLAEGVASAEDIDTAMRMAFNHPMGPLELGDLTGWDTRLTVLQYLHRTLGEKFRPSPLIIKLVKSGRYGRKVGRGVYAYDSSGARIPGSAIRG
jgi:3-hydroxybutyryl-CoA dehydrogenase